MRGIGAEAAGAIMNRYRGFARRWNMSKIAGTKSRSTKVQRRASLADADEWGRRGVIAHGKSPVDCSPIDQAGNRSERGASAPPLSRGDGTSSDPEDLRVGLLHMFRLGLH